MPCEPRLACPYHVTPMEQIITAAYMLAREFEDATATDLLASEYGSKKTKSGYAHSKARKSKYLAAVAWRSAARKMEADKSAMAATAAAAAAAAAIVIFKLPFVHECSWQC